MKNQFYLSLILFVFLFFSITISVPTQWPVNKHYYELLYTQNDTYSGLLTAISKMAPPCPTCIGSWYLATITSEEEYSFCKIAFRYTYFYVGVSRKENFNEFKYVNGPEVNQTVFNVIKNQLSNFGLMADGHPFEGSNYDLIYFDTATNYQVSAIYAGTTPKYYLVEFSNPKDPYVPPTDTQGGPVEMKYLDNFVIDNLVITVTPFDMDPVTVEIISRDNHYKKVIFKMPEMTSTGINTINVFDGFQNFTINQWRYKSPVILSIYPNSTYISLLTIVGENFGVDQSIVIIKTGKDAVNCKYVKIIEPHTSLSCEVQLMVTESTTLLPLYIKVGSSAEIISNRMAIYDRTSVKMFKYFAGASSLSDSAINTAGIYRQSYTLDGNIGYMGVFETLNQYKLYKTMTPLQDLGLVVSPVGTSNGTVIRNFGGYNDGFPTSSLSVCTPNIYCPTGSWNGATTQIDYMNYFIGNRYLMATNGSMVGGPFIAYGGPPLIVPQEFNIDSGGGQIHIKLSKGSTGFKYTKRGYAINGKPVSLPIEAISNDTLGITIPPGTSLQFNLSITIEDFTFDGLFVNYTNPGIVSVASPTTLGGLVTIFGYSFGNDSSVISATIDGVTCENPQIVIEHTAFSCTVLPGVGANKTLTITIGSYVQNTTFSYQPPTIQSVSQVDTFLSITGLSLGIQSNMPSVFVPYNITPSMTLTEPQILTLNVPVYSQNGKIVVQVGGQKGSFPFVYQPYVDFITPLTSTQGNLVSITGRFLTQFRTDGTQTSTRILIGGRQCVAPNFTYDVNGTYITCIAPVGSGAENDFYIVVDGKPSNILKVAYPGPSITSYSQTNSTLTIFGSNFGPDITKVKVEVNSNLFNPLLILTNPQRMVVTLPTSTKNGEIKVKVDGQTSNPLNLTFTPSINTISRSSIYGGLISISGLYFNIQDFEGNDLLYSLTIGGVKCNDTNIINNQLITCTVQNGTGTKEFIFTLGQFTITKDYNYMIPLIKTIRFIGETIEINGTEIYLAGSDTGNIALNVYSGEYNNMDLVYPFLVEGNVWLQRLLFNIPVEMLNGLSFISVDGLNSAKTYLRLTPYINDIISDIPTTGGQITVNGGHFNPVIGGTNATSSNFMRIHGDYCRNLKFFNHTTIICDAPPYTGYKDSYVYFDQAYSNTSKVHYLAPILDQASYNLQNPTYFNFKGNYFGSANYLLRANFGGVLAYPNYVTQTAATVLLPRFIKNGNISVIVDGQESNNQTYILTPAISTTSSVDYPGGILTISGLYLNTIRQDGSSTNPIVFFPNDTFCENITQIADDVTNQRTQISCIAPPANMNNNTDIPVFIQIDGVNSSSILFTYGSPILSKIIVNTTNFVILQGDHFGTNASSIQVLLGGEEITPISSITNSEITFQAPNGVHNDFIIVTKKSNSKSSDPMLLSLYPIISTVTASTTQGSIVTINGKWLNPKREYGSGSYVTPYFNNKVGSVNYMNQDSNTMMLAIAPSGVGTNLNLTLVINGLSSTIFTFNYQVPSITGTSQTGNQLSLLGTNQGNLFAAITIYPNYIISSVSHNSTVLSLPDDASNGPFYVVVQGQVSNTYQVKITPIISSIYPAPPDGGDLTITGSFFNTKKVDGTPLTIVVQINGTTPCTIQSVSSNTQVICSIAAGNFKNVPIKITIDGIVATSTYTALGPVPVSMATSTLYQVQNNITIQGKNFFDPIVVKISGEICPSAYAINTTHITCNFNAEIQPSVAALPVTIISANLENTVNIFRYNDLPCPNNCSLQGICRNGICSCNVGYGGASCHVDVNLTVPLPTVTETGGSIEIEGNIFSTQISFIREVTPEEISVTVYPIEIFDWQLESSTDYGAYTINVSRGTILNTDSWAIRISTYSLKYGHIFEFGGEKVSVDSHSFKETVEIIKYPFDSTNNTLQVIYSSIIPDHITSNCNKYPTKLTKWNSPYGSNQLLAYDFENPVAVYTARFTTRLVIDSKITTLDVQPLTDDDPIWLTKDGYLQTLIAMNIPHFQTSAKFDPSFSGHKKDYNIIPCPSTTNSSSNPTGSQTTSSSNPTGSQTTNGQTTNGQTTNSQTTGQTTGQTNGQTTGQTTNGQTTNGQTTNGQTTSNPTSSTTRTISGSSIPVVSSSSSSGSTGNTVTCKGTPVCSGHGLCDSSTSKCICYGDWKGEICDSEQTKIPPVNPNPDKPTTNSSTDDINFDISVISLREITFMEKFVRETPLKNWGYNKIASDDVTSYIYTTKVLEDKCTVIVKIDYFYKDTVIEFAGTNTTKTTGSIKYSVNVTTYPFLNNHNLIQVVFSATAQERHNSDDSCTLKTIEYGDNSQDVRTINIQINNKTFSSSFTNLAVIDKRISKIKNIIIKSDQSDTPTKSNVLVGMTAPKFETSLIIDPDFSLLLSHVPASEKDGSICNSSIKSSKKLGKGQIAGIVIGCFCFLVSAAIISAYMIKKNRENKRFNKNLQSKLNSIN